MTFAEKLKKARVDAGYTQEELATILLVSRAAIAKWESDRGMPDVLNLKSIAETLNISIDYLLDNDTRIDFAIVKKPIDLTKFGDVGKLSRYKKLEIKERFIREEYPNAEIKRLTLTKIRNTKEETIADQIIGWFGLLLGGIPLFGTQEFGKMANSIKEQYYIVNEERKQYFIMMTDELLIQRSLAHPINEKKFSIGERDFQVVGLVD